jgi:hypothetical protein
MEILKVKENKDGSGIIECEFSNEEIQIFLNYAINSKLK